MSGLSCSGLVHPVTGEPLGVAPSSDSKSNPTAALDVNAHLVAMSGAATWTRLRTALWASSAGDQALAVGPMLWNGNGFEAPRNNIDGVALASAARTVTTQSADQINHNARGLHVVIDVTAVAGLPSLVFTVQGRDVLSGKYYPILASAAITTVSTVILRVFPGLTAVANLVANDILSRTWRLHVAPGTADSVTYSVGYALVN
ncbi:MAG: hypothetical protein DDT21_02425 [Syntrophomonadaceae bacterium]|nr:hypothetical protein [Bacillota bacterium]